MGASVKRPYTPKPGSRLVYARAFRVEKVARTEELNRKILEVIRTLTPPPCRECSTLEIFTSLKLQGIEGISVRALGSRLGILHAGGMVRSRILGQRHLWSLGKNVRLSSTRAAKSS